VRRLVALTLLSAAAAADPIDDASKRLLDDDPDVRLAAAGRLGALGPLAAPAVPLLVGAAYDEEDQVARAAIDALGRIGPAAAEAMRGLSELGAANPRLQGIIERALRATGGGSGGTPAPVRRPAEELIPLIDHPQPSVRMRAIWALVNDHAADPAFAAMLGDPRVRRRRVAAQHLFGAASLSHLRKALKDSDMRVRRGVLRSLSSLGAEAAPALEDLLAVLEERDPALADSFYFHSLGRLAPVRVARALTLQLAAAHPACRAAACRALGQLGPHAAPAVPSLLEACFDEEPQVVSAAISTLRSLGAVAKEAAPDLAALFDADPQFGDAGRLTLQAVARGTTLPPPPDPPDFEALRVRLADRDGATAAFAAFTIGRLAPDDAETLEALASALRHPAPAARKHAALALRRIGQASLPVLARVAKEGRGADRRLAAAALARLARAHPDAVLPVALALLEDDDPYVRREATRAIGIIGPPAREAAPRLLDHLEGEEAWFAAWALGRLRADAAVPALVRLLDLPRGDDQQAITQALLALGEIGPAAEPALPAIVAEARRPDDSHFRDALDALVRIGAPGQAEVVRLIRDETGPNRLTAINLLMAVDLRPPGLAEALDAAATDADSTVRQTALLAAAGLKAPTVDSLIAAAKAEPADRFGRSRLPETLAQVATVANLLEVTRDLEAQVRSIAWSALARKKRGAFTADDAARALPLLLDALRDPKTAHAAAPAAHVVPLGAPDARLFGFLAPPSSERSFDAYVAEQVGKAIHDLGPRIVPAVAEALRHDDARIRAGAAIVLEGFGPAARAAVPALREAVPADATAAVPFVRAIVSAADLETIAFYFADTALPVRVDFGDALVAAGKDALPLLDALRQHDDPRIRGDTVTLLGRCSGVPPDWIVKATGDEDDHVACVALSLLDTAIPAEQAVPILARAAEGDGLRSTALHALVQLGARGLPTLGALATNPRPAVRAAALDGLGGAGAEALGFLAEGLKDKEPEVRATAAGALRRLGVDAAPAISALRALLEDPDRHVRCQAAGTLGKLKAEDAVPDLVRLLGSADAGDRAAAARALASVGEKGAAALAPFLSHPEETYRNVARLELAGMGEEAVPALAALLAAEDGRTRREAATLLAKIGEPAIDALKHALQAKGAAERLDAAWALGRMGTQAAPATTDLVAALEDPDPQVVPQAAWALGQIGPAARDALPSLEKLRDARKHTVIVSDAIRRIRGS